jgi:hypothetical protein
MLTLSRTGTGWDRAAEPRPRGAKRFGVRRPCAALNRPAMGKAPQGRRTPRPVDYPQIIQACTRSPISRLARTPEGWPVYSNRGIAFPALAFCFSAARTLAINDFRHLGRAAEKQTVNWGVGLGGLSTGHPYGVIGALPRSWLNHFRLRSFQQDAGNSPLQNAGARHHNRNSFMAVKHGGSTVEL